MRISVPQGNEIKCVPIINSVRGHSSCSRRFFLFPFFLSCPMLLNWADYYIINKLSWTRTIEFLKDMWIYLLIRKRVPLSMSNRYGVLPHTTTADLPHVIGLYNYFEIHIKCGVRSIFALFSWLHLNLASYLPRYLATLGKTPSQGLWPAQPRTSGRNFRIYPWRDGLFGISNVNPMIQVNT